MGTLGSKASKKGGGMLDAATRMGLCSSRISVLYTEHAWRMPVTYDMRTG